MKKYLVIAAFGGGTNSSAMLVRWVNEGRPLDLVLFADTGGEKPETYCHVERFSHWLAKKGYPEIITVKKVDKNGSVETLENRSLKKKMLPSIAYGYKKCSLKYKVGPQDKFVNNWEPAKEVFKRGGRVIKLIGFDAGEEHRILKAKAGPYKPKYREIYPLFRWGWGRKECVTSLELEGIKLPGKSSCWFCPNMKQMEIRELASKYPELMARAIIMERTAKPKLTSIKGLGRDWSWENFINQGEMFPGMFPESRGIEICCNCYDG